jgi:site-specific DNA recombinase
MGSRPLPRDRSLRAMESTMSSRTTTPRTGARRTVLQLDPLWDELSPAEQARIVQLLVARVDVRMHGAEVRLRPNGLTGLVRDVVGSRRAAT